MKIMYHKLLIKIVTKFIKFLKNMIEGMNDYILLR